MRAVLSEEPQGYLVPIGNPAGVILGKGDLAHEWFEEVVAALERIAILYWRGKELFDPETGRAYQRLNVVITNGILSSSILAGSGLSVNAMITLRAVHERINELLYIFHKQGEFQKRANRWLTQDRFDSQAAIRESLDISGAEYGEFCNAAHLSGVSFDRYYRKGDVKVPTPEIDKIDDERRRNPARSSIKLTFEDLFPDFHDWEPGPGISQGGDDLHAIASEGLFDSLSKYISELCVRAAQGNMRAIRKVKDRTPKDEFKVLMAYGRACEELEPLSLEDLISKWYVDTLDEPLE